MRRSGNVPPNDHEDAAARTVQASGAEAWWFEVLGDRPQLEGSDGALFCIVSAMGLRCSNVCSAVRDVAPLGRASMRVLRAGHAGPIAGTRER